MRGTLAERFTPPIRQSTAGENGSRVHEAETVAKRVQNVERALAPRPLDDLTRVRIVHLLLRKAAEFAGTRVKALEVVDGKINVVGIRLGLRAFAFRIQERQNHGAAIEVMTRTADVSSFDVEQFRVERHGLLQIGDLNDHAKQVRSVCHLSSCVYSGGFARTTEVSICRSGMFQYCRRSDGVWDGATRSKP